VGELMVANDAVLGIVWIEEITIFAGGADYKLIIDCAYTTVGNAAAINLALAGNGNV